MALLRIMSWTSLPYLPTQSLLGATLTATERARLRPCRTIQSMPDTSAGWKDTWGSTCTVYHPRSPPPPPETRVSAWSLAGTPVLTAHRPPCPEWPSLTGHSQPQLRPQSRDAPGCKTRRKLRFDISKERLVQLPEDPLRGRGDREPRKVHTRGLPSKYC